MYAILCNNTPTDATIASMFTTFLIYENIISIYVGNTSIVLQTNRHYLYHYYCLSHDNVFLFRYFACLYTFFEQVYFLYLYACINIILRKQLYEIHICIICRLCD